MIIEEQKQQIKGLQEELAEFNCVQYRTLPGNSSRGKNVLRTSKKMSMTATDHINQQAVASYVREAIWPGNKMLPKSRSKWRDDKRSLCQMVLKKVALPVGVDGKSYWEAEELEEEGREGTRTKGRNPGTVPTAEVTATAPPWFLVRAQKPTGEEVSSRLLLPVY